MSDSKNNAQVDVVKQKVSLLQRVKFLFYTPKWRIYDWFYNTKAKFQRFRRGYADKDVWDLDRWFIETVKPMLQQLHDGHMGYPGDMTPELWEETLRDMIRCLDYMDESAVEAHLGLENDPSPQACEEIWSVMTENKDRFFELFSKYFWKLWD